MSPLNEIFTFILKLFFQMLDFMMIGHYNTIQQQLIEIMIDIKAMMRT